jgi:hypothetical protein
MNASWTVGPGHQFEPGEPVLPPRLQQEDQQLVAVLPDDFALTGHRHDFLNATPQRVALAVRVKAPEV